VKIRNPRKSKQTQMKSNPMRQNPLRKEKKKPKEREWWFDLVNELRVKEEG
jgi:hypothetical protein